MATYPTSVRLTDRTKQLLAEIADFLDLGGRGRSKAIEYAVDFTYRDLFEEQFVRVPCSKAKGKKK